MVSGKLTLTSEGIEIEAPSEAAGEVLVQLVERHGTEIARLMERH